MNNNLELYLMLHQEKLLEVERLNQRHLRTVQRKPRRFDLRRLLAFFL